jgi:hypothetical protein
VNVKRLLFGLVTIPALVAGMVTPSVLAQSPGAAEAQIPAVEVHPTGTTREDPNGGQWFVTSLDFEEKKTLQARLYNPAEVPQTVKLFLADMRFDDAGLPEVANVSTDIGLWGRFVRPNVTIRPKESLVEAFSITAPKGADPGDHVGAVVVEQAPQGSGLIRSVKRLAVRLYATLPGDARKQFEIDEVSTEKDSALFAKELTVTVHLKNTGRVRLEPAVKVDDAGAEGPELLMSSATERYVVTRPVKFWGGPMRLRIDATTKSLGLAGPVRQMRVTVWVIPWHLLLMIAVAVGMFFGVRWLLRRRGHKYEALQADLQRIERLVTMQHRAPAKGGSTDASGVSSDARAAIVSAIKQAKRSGDLATAERLEELLGSTTAAESKPRSKPKPPSARKPKNAQRRRPPAKRPGR